MSNARIILQTLGEQNVYLNKNPYIPFKKYQKIF